MYFYFYFSLVVRRKIVLPRGIFPPQKALYLKRSCFSVVFLGASLAITDRTERPSKDGRHQEGPEDPGDVVT